MEYVTIEASQTEEDEEAESQQEDDDFQDDNEEPEYGSQLSVVMKHNDRYYQFVMYHNCVEIGTPVMLLRTILFLVKLIDDTAAAQLIEYLMEISSDPLVAHNIADKKFRDAAYDIIRLKIETTDQLIQDDKADLN